ncbi:hypothetical protein MLA66_003165 [Salmonella enterica]|nr:hypothetical protein [Salmonella enterica]EEM7113016.1 hypothetical protein [Salmonella enterica subsp. enterica serovar Poona]HBI5523281.1 hypothetical protein [Salmonella enterica subsp. enterica serovar Welikade]EAS9889809.1 hypothetical protein [Salmonella enterica]EEG2844243.1 hypothetical protein [Salmonella enterica]
MKNIIQLYFPAKKATQKQHNIAAGTAWYETDDQDEADARATLDMKRAGYKRSDFFKPVRVDHLVVDDMPEEGVFDTAFCNRYGLGEDGKSWLLPAAQPGNKDNDSTGASNQGQGSEDVTGITGTGDATSATGTTESSGTGAEGVCTETAGDTLPAYEFNVNGEPMEEVLKEADISVATLPFIARFLHIFFYGTDRKGDRKELHWASVTQRREVALAEMNQEDSYIQNMLIVIRGMPELDKLNNLDTSKLAGAIRGVFSPDKKAPQPSEFKNFINAYREAGPLDREILVKKWQKGECVSRNEKTSSETRVSQGTTTTEFTDTGRPRRNEKPTFRTINYELACGLYDDMDYNNLRPAMDFAKRIIAEDREDWKSMSITVGIIPNIKNYDRKTVIDLTRKAPKAVLNGDPELRRTWCESFLAVHGVIDPDWYEYVPDGTSTTHAENANRIRQAGKRLRDIEAGRFQDDEEKPQPTDTLADEPATPEAVEQGTTEHHPDPKPLENEPPVSRTGAGYQKIRAELHEARKNILPKNPVDAGKQLAAARGEYVEGISDPNDPKWVRDDYSASNQGEKEEVVTGGEVALPGHLEEFSNHSGAETHQNESVVQQSEPQTQGTESELQQTAPAAQQEGGQACCDVRVSKCKEVSQMEVIHETVRLLREHEVIIREITRRQEADRSAREKFAAAMISAVAMLCGEPTDGVADEKGSH